METKLNKKSISVISHTLDIIAATMFPLLIV